MDASTDTKDHFQVSEPQFISPRITQFDMRDPADVNIRGFKWTLNAYEKVAVGTTVIALMATLCIVGTSGHPLSVYHQTTSGADSGLPLWPNDFTIRPTVALVACGSVSMIMSLTSLFATMVCSYHSKIRARPLIQSCVTYACSMIALIVSVTAIGIFYHADNSDTTWSLQSWSCQWKDVSMSSPPYWNALCGESKAALYLTILLVPTELVALAGISLGAKKKEQQRRSALAMERLTSEKLNAELGEIA